jgi:GTPase SAR1 family protein
VVLLGDSNSGKSSILERQMTMSFVDCTATIGAAYQNIVIRINDEQTVQLDIWDTAGAERWVVFRGQSNTCELPRFQAITPMYYRGSHAAIIVGYYLAES